jgi:hypothetical protein
MKNRCKEFGELSLANRLAGCVNIDINCAALRPKRVSKSNWTVTKPVLNSDTYVVEDRGNFRKWCRLHGPEVANDLIAMST